MANNGNIYVTFSIKYITESKRRRFAVKCQCKELARKVASDINSFDGFQYIRICSKPHITKEVKVMSNDDYFKYKEWM